MPDDVSDERSITPRHARRQSWARFARALRPGRNQIAVTLALALVGYGLVVQIRTSRTDDAFSSMRRTDLVALLETLDSQTTRLEDEVARLTQTRDKLRSGADSARVAEAEAQSRLKALQVLAGTVPASGPGIRIVISDPSGKVGPTTLVDGLQEMRDAGAEVMEFNDSIRVVAQTWVKQTSDGLVVDGQRLERPIVLDVIGDPETLEQGARFRGGLVSQITDEKVGGSVSIEQLTTVDVTSVREHEPPRYAKPA